MTHMSFVCWRTLGHVSLCAMRLFFKAGLYDTIVLHGCCSWQICLTPIYLMAAVASRGSGMWSCGDA
jgi:hypothetical protein